MITIDLELLQNPNFPSLEILESRTKIVLENFNRCRKLNIKLHIKNDKIEEFCRLFNSITDRRALESLRLSMYAEDVDIYIKLLSEENTSVGVILETLSSLLDAAQERHETTKKLKEDYIEFFKNFNNEFANIEIHLTSDPSDPLLDNRHTSATRESAPSRTALIRTGNSADNSVIKYIPLLVACGTFVYTFYKPPLNLNLGYVFVPLFIFKKEKEFLSKKYQDVQNVVTTKDNQEKLQNSEIVITDSDNNSFKDDKNKESSKNFIDSVLNEVEKETVFNTKNDVDRSTNVDITPTLTVNTVPTKNVQSSENFIDNILDEIENSLKEGYSIPNTNYEDEGFYESVDRLTNVDTPPTPPTPTPTPNVPSPVGTTPIPNVGATPNSLINRLLTASIFGILVYCSIRKFLRPAQRLWNYFMNKNKPKLRNMLYEQQREKYAKILDIKEKLPVIIQNVEILDQFWDYQITNIKSHIETLKSVDENEKIRFPQQIAALIEENWNKQYSESKANYNRMKELVTINSLLSPDVSILC
jgi:hypothetical protein